MNESNYINETFYFDFNHLSVQNFINEFRKKGLSKKEQAIGLYTKVRDHFRYNAYSITLIKEKYKSSHIIEKTEGNCVEKSIVLIACLRALEIPARIHLGKVKNHIAVERLTEKFGTNELTPHGMVNAFIEGKWLKLSPAFNKSLCERMNVPVVDFDGEHSSYLQRFDAEGKKFMEYTDDYGHFEDVPVDFMIDKLKQFYPHIFDTGEEITEFNV